MEIAQKTLIEDLLENLEKSMTTVKNLQELSLEKLNHKKSDISWSVLECLEHLNLYGYFYFPEIKKAIEKSIRQTINEQNQQTKKSANQTFQSGFWGGIFVNLIQVKNGKIKKMKTVKDKIPASSGLNHNTIITFLTQLDVLKLFLEETREREIDMMKTKTAIALTKFIKLRLGDTFRFLIYHIERHVLQAKNTQI